MFSTNNYNIIKRYVYYPNNRLEIPTISLKNIRSVSKNGFCKHCDSETCYDCSQCDKGITEIFKTVPASLIKKLVLIENLISEKLMKLEKKELDKFKSKEIVINYLQKKILSNNLSEKDLKQLIILNNDFGHYDEVSYYFSKCLNYIDSEIVFLIKLYNLIINIARGDLNPFDFFFYDRFRKYKYLIDTHRIELPLTKKEFDELYQNTPDYIGSLLNYYCPKKKYPRQIISNKNYHCDINFETVAECRSRDNKITYLNYKIEKKMGRAARDKIRAEFGVKKYVEPKKLKLPKIELKLKLINCN